LREIAERRSAAGPAAYVPILLQCSKKFSRCTKKIFARRPG
jgi:hypothetical protein